MSLTNLLANEQAVIPMLKYLMTMEVEKQGRKADQEEE